MDVLMTEQSNPIGTTMKQLISQSLYHFIMAYTSRSLDQQYLLTDGIQEAEQQCLTLKKNTIIVGMYMRYKNYINPLRYYILQVKICNNKMIPGFMMTNPSNPVDMMSFLRARGNASQVDELIDMRRLMSDPQGQND
ncbi:hypothetical protein RJ639_019106 [Escallonia herrerae]|uniref:DNA-directed RNA polymerase n=1 Tax=Escallonia herrerae TaxID=1293975 RepID=A0AA89AIQ0_9ASTE|nr:hypothetical protein RJ639_019106 [Escallonia herrerae]